MPGGVTSDVTETFAPTAVALGKRRRGVEEPLDGGVSAVTHAHEIPLSKRARGGEAAEGIPKAERSVAKTRSKPAARIPKARINRKPKEAGRGAERLATPSSQGLYHQSMPGPSFQQGWAVGAANGKPVRVEGSVDEEAVHIGSTVQQQNGKAIQLFVIPHKLDPEHRSFLEASEVDFARGVVEAIKCHLCPKAKISSFDKFERHYRTSEAHPQEIHFCDLCGDFFARTDALKRHRGTPPECREATPARAAEKHRVTVEIYEDFNRRMDYARRTDNVKSIEKGFAQLVKERFRESSKKRRWGSKA